MKYDPVSVGALLAQLHDIAPGEQHYQKMTPAMWRIWQLVAKSDTVRQNGLICRSLPFFGKFRWYRAFCVCWLRFQLHS